MRPPRRRARRAEQPAAPSVPSARATVSLAPAVAIAPLRRTAMGRHGLPWARLATARLFSAGHDSRLGLGGSRGWFEICDNRPPPPSLSSGGATPGLQGGAPTTPQVPNRCHGRRGRARSAVLCFCSESYMPSACVTRKPKAWCGRARRRGAAPPLPGGARGALARPAGPAGPLYSAPFVSPHRIGPPRPAPCVLRWAARNLLLSIPAIALASRRLASRRAWLIRVASQGVPGSACNIGVDSRTRVSAMR